MRDRLLKMAVAGVALVAMLAVGVAAAGAAQQSVRATPGTVTIVGAVIGTGGGGSNAWSLPVSGATIAVEGATETATTAADGTYSLTAIVSVAPYYAGKAITATQQWYITGRKLLGGDAFQVQVFLLTVKSTKYIVTVKSGSKKVKGAKVTCFGKSRLTNKRGVATLSGLKLKPQTKYTVKITKKGYKTRTFRALSRPGSTVRFTKNITRK